MSSNEALNKIGMLAHCEAAKSWLLKPLPSVASLTPITSSSQRASEVFPAYILGSETTDSPPNADEPFGAVAAKELTLPKIKCVQYSASTVIPCMRTRVLVPLAQGKVTGQILRSRWTTLDSHRC